MAPLQHQPLPVSSKPWERAQQRFLEGLSDHEKTLFHHATPENLFYAADVAQRKHGEASTFRKIQRRLDPLKSSLQSYGQALDVYANASATFLCPIWGSIRLLLAWSQASDRQFVLIVKMLARIGDALPLFRSYESLFGSEDLRLMNLIVDGYFKILCFCSDLKDFLTNCRRSRGQ